MQCFPSPPFFKQNSAVKISVLAVSISFSSNGKYLRLKKNMHPQCYQAIEISVHNIELEPIALSAYFRKAEGHNS